ncbi:MAG: hypothetical protein K5829_05820 [Treponema sp.]|nr:hypothetical protein [Treponema sp.]
MATWKQIRDCILSEFNNSNYNEESDILRVILEWNDKREQVVLITTAEGKNDTWIHIFSRIGTVNKNDLYPLLREAQDSLSGGIVAIEDQIWFRIELCMNEDLEMKHIINCVNQAGIWADDFEEKYVGGDES